MATLHYDEEHVLLREQARRWFAERSPIAAVRRLSDDSRGDDPQLWRELAQLGWLGLVVPEAHGGSGLGFTHLAVLLEEAGRQLLPSPLLPTALAALVIERGGSDAQRARLLPRMAAGELLVSLAQVEPDGGWQAQDTRTVRAQGRLSGEKHHVWAAPTAALFIVPFRQDGTVRLAVVDARAEGVTVVPEHGLDRTRRSGRLVMQNVAVADDAIFPIAAEDVFAHLLPRACAALAAEMAGGADALLAMTAAYAATRVQFGRPIGSFQAIKHPLVNVLIALEHGRSLVYAAATALDAEAPDAELLARMAKAQLSETYMFAAARAVQSHGGFGFTVDCDVHFYFKRAYSSRPAFGDAMHHRRWIADRLIAPAP
ncbi:MAG TPA: acyl-CoA dehydrogenase family protein [Candidatus Margulisiibacteriota bacterium]|nr:acyl-CoA dehydrogenase family protein [Candidatus Margulisiibacteriota bacterium]